MVGIKNQDHVMSIEIHRYYSRSLPQTTEQLERRTSSGTENSLFIDGDDLLDRCQSVVFVLMGA